MQGYATHVRGLVFVSHADLGSYREANDAYLAGRDKKADITLHRHQGPVKPGLRLSFEQDYLATSAPFGAPAGMMVTTNPLPTAR
jgi:hypothetical protein